MKKSYENAIAKIRELGFTEPSTKQERRNPITGVECILEPLACMLYDFIVFKFGGTPSEMLCRGQKVTRQTWDHARWCFQTTWSDEYYKLID